MIEPKQWNLISCCGPACNTTPYENTITQGWKQGNKFYCNDCYDAGKFTGFVKFKLDPIIIDSRYICEVYSCRSFAVSYLLNEDEYDQYFEENDVDDLPDYEIVVPEMTGVESYRLQLLSQEGYKYPDSIRDSLLLPTILPGDLITIIKDEIYVRVHESFVDPRIGVTPQQQLFKKWKEYYPETQAEFDEELKLITN